jgi:hypothetical protein
MADKKRLLWIHFGEETSEAPKSPELRFLFRKRYLEPTEWHSLSKNAQAVLLSAENPHAETIFQVTDHINVSGFNPLVGLNNEQLGPRFFDMSNVYTQKSDDFNLAFPETLISAGKLSGNTFEAPIFEASQIVYQAIINMHQGKKTTALILPAKVSFSEIWKKIRR